MADIHTIHVEPALINASCAWASTYGELKELYDSPYTGAVTSRTATLDGFKEGPDHQVAFESNTITSLNSYGYSPHPLSQYIQWIAEIIYKDPAPRKSFIVSITASEPKKLATMVDSIQSMRTSAGPHPLWENRIAIELNTSCPNIAGAPPPAYCFSTLRPLLQVLAEAFERDPTLTIGLKLPPYVHAGQFVEVVEGIASFTTKEGKNPFAYFACTNTLGSSLLFGEQAGGNGGGFAVPPVLGGLAGESIHALSLGNVYSFACLIRDSADPGVQKIKIIGVGGVTTPAAVERMRNAGALVVGAATLLGKEGVRAFEILSQHK